MNEIQKETLELVLQKITAQQTGKENTAVFVVGEQLKDICRREPDSAALVLRDLDVKGMSVSDAEKKIKKYADNHKTGNFAFIPPDAAEDIIREFYGLGGAKPEEPPAPAPGIINLADFL